MTVESAFRRDQRLVRHCLAQDEYVTGEECLHALKSLLCGERVIPNELAQSRVARLP